MIYGVKLPWLMWMGLKNPKAAARLVISWNIPRPALWTLLALVCIGNALVSWAMFAAIPMLAPEIGSELMAQGVSPEPPLVTFVKFAAFMVIASHMFHWLGGLLGGTGRLNDVVAVMTLWVAIQVCLAVVFILSLFTIPFLALVIGMVMVFAVPWTLVHFVNEATGLQSLWKTTGVIFTAIVGTFFGLLFFLTLTGLARFG